MKNFKKLDDPFHNVPANENASTPKAEKPDDAPSLQELMAASEKARAKAAEDKEISLENLQKLSAQKQAIDAIDADRANKILESINRGEEVELGDDDIEIIDEAA